MEQPCVHSTPSETNPDNAQSMGEAIEAVIGSVRVPLLKTVGKGGQRTGETVAFGKLANFRQSECAIPLAW